MRIKFESLKTRLTIALLLAVLLPTIFIGWLASNTMFENIRAERIADVGRIASSKHDQLVMVLTRANNRAEHFLSDLSVQCSGNPTTLNKSCAIGLINSYLASEGAIGATLRKKGMSNLTIGTSATRNKEPAAFQPGQLAKFSETGPRSDHSYFVSVAQKSAGLVLTVTYSASQLTPVFVPHPKDLGISGETFLADGEGFFATPPRYPSTQGHSHPITARPMESCLSGQSREVLDLDYRDAAIIHGFRFIPEFGSACIMAHVDQDEAFAPLKSLQQKIMFAILLFGAALIIMAIYLARSIVKPITRLTEVARTIARGDIKAKADVTGNDEISELATSFNFMTSQLRDSYDDLHRLLNSMVEGVYGVDTNGNCTFVNQSFLRILGYQNDSELLGKNMHELIHHSHADGSPYPKSQCKIYRAYQVIQMTNVADEVFWRRDGVAIPVEYWSHPVVADGVVTGSIVTFVDITERKAAEQQLRNHSAHLQYVREEEKASIAREIHDDLGGTLTALKMETYWLKNKLSASKEVAPLSMHVDEMSLLIDNATGVMRNIITGLRPTVLDDLGLLAALEWQAAQFQKHTGIACRVNCVCEKSADCSAIELDKQRSIALFRISQEALTNVARHSGATRVEIEFHYSDEEIVMSIIDNGRGMTENRTGASKSYGILGMRERVDQLGGRINFDIPPGGGFSVTIILPLPTSKNEET